MKSAPVESNDLAAYQGDGTAEDVLRWALDSFHPHIALACSFEDLVLVHMMANIRPDIRVFSIDTGRLNEATFECAETAREKYGVDIEWYAPQREAVEALERKKGLYSFRNSLEERHECCGIRKVEPLTRALSGLQAWVTGLRKDQGVTRTEIKKVDRDTVHGGILKINPLADWTHDDLWSYIHKHNVPYNRLLDCGYASIGCAPCTRAITPGDHPRNGRWWWENPEHKECGIHVKPIHYNI